MSRSWLEDALSVTHSFPSYLKNPQNHSRLDRPLRAQASSPAPHDCGRASRPPNQAAAEPALCIGRLGQGVDGHVSPSPPSSLVTTIRARWTWVTSCAAVSPIHPTARFSATILSPSQNVWLAFLSSPAPGYASPRQWISVSPVNRPIGVPINITSYNMLADIYCQPDLYSQCPLWALEWPYRRDRLIHQLNSRNSDFFCLQEIEKSEYEEFWLPEMEKRGYLGV